MSKMELRCLKTWNKLLPDYEIKLWNEKNFPIEKYSFAAKAYQQEKFAFVADVARLHAVYYEGGIYLDTDMLLLRNLDFLLDHSFFSGYYKPGKLAVGIFGCEPKHPLAQMLLEQYNSTVFDPSKLYIITEHFDSLLQGKQTEYDRVVFYEDDFFYSLPFEMKSKSFKKFLTERSVAVHLWNHSWKDEFSSLKLFFFRDSLIQHIQHLLSFKRVYWKRSYLIKYYKTFYLKIKQLIHKKVYRK